MMSWRSIRALTLVLLGLVLAAPLSSGDKGLWLSLTSTPVQHLQTVGRSLPAEHGIVLPDDASRFAATSAAARPERTDTDANLTAALSLRSMLRWTVTDAEPAAPDAEPIADRPAPRAPPV
jgi:hypothetical protein